MLPWDLEDWITDTGADILDKRLANPNSLSRIEELVYQIWLLDTETRNGGLSQYFCNWGIEQWRACEAIAQSENLGGFAPFVNAINVIIADQPDPYTAVIEHGGNAEGLWNDYQSLVIRQLKGLCQKD